MIFGQELRKHHEGVANPENVKEYQFCILFFFFSSVSGSADTCGAAPRPQNCPHQPFLHHSRNLKTSQMAAHRTNSPLSPFVAWSLNRHQYLLGSGGGVGVLQHCPHHLSNLSADLLANTTVSGNLPGNCWPQISPRPTRLRPALCIPILCILPGFASGFPLTVSSSTNTYETISQTPLYSLRSLEPQP